MTCIPREWVMHSQGSKDFGQYYITRDKIFNPKWIHVDIYILTVTCAVLLDNFQNLLYSLDNIVLLWDTGKFQALGIRHGNIHPSHSHYRGLQIVEGGTCGKKSIRQVWKLNVWLRNCCPFSKRVWFNKNTSTIL